MVEPTQRKPGSSAWEMPEPVFRTTEGKTPGSTADQFSFEDDVPTDPGTGKVDPDNVMRSDDKDSAPTKNEGEIKSALVQDKRGLNLNIAMTLVFVGFALLVLIAYLLWAYYFTSSTTTAPPY